MNSPEKLPTNLSCNVVQTLRTLVELQPMEFITMDELSGRTLRWIYEGLATKRQLTQVHSEHGIYTNVFIGEIPDFVYGTKSVVAVDRRSLVRR